MARETVARHVWVAGGRVWHFGEVLHGHWSAAERLRQIDFATVADYLDLDYRLSEAHADDTIIG